MYPPKPADGVFKLGKLLVNSEEQYCGVINGRVVGRLNAGLSFGLESNGSSFDRLMEGWKLA